MWTLSEKVLTIFVSTLISLTFSLSAAADTASRIAEIKKQRQITENRVARYLGDLEAAQESLDSFEPKVTSAFLKAKEQPSDETARAATIIAIDYNRRIAKVERMEKRVADNQAKLADIEAELTEAARKLAAEQKRKKEHAQPHKPASPKKIEPSTVYEALTANKAAPEKPSTTNKKSSTAIKKANNLATREELSPQASPSEKVETQTLPLGEWPSYASASKADKTFVKQQLDEARLAIQNGDKPLLPKVVIRARRSFGTEKMSYLGNDLYGLEATISSGHQKFDIFNKKFWLNVPESEDQQRYFFVFDAESLARPKLYAFRIEVLD